MESILDAQGRNGLYDSVSEVGLVFSDVVDNCDAGLLLLDRRCRVVQWNAWLAAVSGVSAAQALGCPLESVMPHLKGTRLLSAVDAALNEGRSDGYCARFPLDKRGEEKAGMPDLCRVLVKPLDLSGRHCLVQFFNLARLAPRDDLPQAEQLADEKERRKTLAILSFITDAVITTDLHGAVDFMNSAAERLTGWALSQACGRPLQEVFNAYDETSRAPLIDPVQGCLKSEQAQVSEYGLVLLNRSGVGTLIEASFIPICDGQEEAIGVVLVFQDVSNARKLAAQISWQTNHDSLTGLVNRATFDQKLDALLRRAKSEGSVHAMLYLDVDQFKVINDTCGHVAGDELLRQIASLLSVQVRNDDTLARLGGDEFGILLRGCPQERALDIAAKVRHAVRNYSYIWAGQSFALSVSIGVVMISEESSGMEAVLSAADAACYAAKEEGRDRVHLFRTDQGKAARYQGEMQWANRINIALEEDRFRLFVQPIQSLSGRGEGGHYEVLIRMLDGVGNLVPPGAFIPAAERFNLMPRVDRWVVSRLFRLIRKFYTFLVGGQHRFAINLSGASISDEDTLNYIGEQMIANGIPEGMISFEITETAAIANLSSANYFIRTLKQSGCAFALDDFGSGFSSFAYLKNLPVDYLKIDGAFVKGMVEDPIDCAMVEAINRIGHVMNIKTIAEFAENDAILKRLRQLGVDYAQGYGISRPLPLLDAHGRLSLEEAALSQL